MFTTTLMTTAPLGTTEMFEGKYNLCATGTHQNTLPK